MEPNRAIVITRAARLAREAVLAPITDGQLAVRTVRRLAEAVNFSIFAIGERLPPETELAERLGISVVTLRTALAVLRDIGCLDTRRGRDGGTYVADRKMMPAGLARTVPRPTPEYVQDLLSYGLAVEPHGAALAAARATADDVAELGALAEQVETVTELPELRNNEAAFHIRVASCSQSLRLTRAAVELQSELTALCHMAKIRPGSFRAVREDHRAIVAAIGARDVELARSLMETHVTLGLSRFATHSEKPWLDRASNPSFRPR